MATVEELIKDAQTRMEKSVEHAHNEFNTVRTGRASAGLLDRIDVDYYGTKTPLKQLATIGVPEARMLTIQPFDPGSIRNIEKSIMESDLGLTPSNDGKMIRLPIPQLTEERRKELVKVVRGPRGGSPDRGARDPARRDEGAEGARRLGRRRRRRGASRRGAGAEAHRRSHEADRRPAEAQGSRGHGGLVARPLAPDRVTASAHRRRPAEAHGLPEVARAVAIIMDGNGRWASARGVGVADGHRAGSRALRPVVETAIDLGVESLAVYAFSTENWSRSGEEVEALMEIFGETIDRELNDLAKEGVRTRFVGRRDRAPDWLQAKIAGPRDGDGRQVRGSISGSRSTTAAAPSSSRLPAGSPRAASSRRTSTRRASRGISTRRRCRIPIS